MNYQDLVKWVGCIGSFTLLIDCDGIIISTLINEPDSVHFDVENRTITIEYMNTLISFWVNKVDVDDEDVIVLSRNGKLIFTAC